MLLIKHSKALAVALWRTFFFTKKDKKSLKKYREWPMHLGESYRTKNPNNTPGRKYADIHHSRRMSSIFIRHLLDPWPIRLKKSLKTWKKELKSDIKEWLRLSLDYKIGMLYGEIIWEKILGKYTEHGLIQSVCTKEEAEMYEKLRNDIPYDFKNNGVEDKELINKAFKEYRKYAHSLQSKYFPLTLKFEDWINYKPYNLKKFYRGIESFLWNTDECSYRSKFEDLKISTDSFGRMRTRRMELTFTLDYATDEKEKTN